MAFTELGVWDCLHEWPTRVDINPVSPHGEECSKYVLHVEKSEILTVGLELLGTVGARQCSARAVEDAAGIPHGTVRHHFGHQAGLLEALVDHLLAIEQTHTGDDLHEAANRALDADRVYTRARFELLLISLRTPVLVRKFLDARDSRVEELHEAGIPRHDARTRIAALDGLVLDALLRDHYRLDAQ
ncbi:TetR/AcrR family transcriptional regulator [Actinomycetes bacterium M1A6_2h]